MVGQQRKEATEDLLKYCRNQQHQMQAGHGLGPELLQRAWRGPDDDAHLKSALHDLIAQDLAIRRTKLGVSKATLQDDVRTGNDDLVRCSLVWAYYFEHSKTRDLALIVNLGQRAVQDKVQEGRMLVEQLIAEQERSVVKHDANLVQAGVNCKEPRASLAPSMVSPTQPVLQTPPPSQNNVYRAEQIYNGPVNNVFMPMLPTAVDSATAPRPRRSLWQRTREPVIVGAVALIMLSLANLLLRNAPQISVGVLLSLGGWRLGMNLWRLVQATRSERREREEVVWQLSRVMYWLALCGWTIALFQNATGSVTTLDQLTERLAWSTTYVALAASMLFSSAIDLLLWVKRENATTWPWDKLQRYAANVHRGRWFMLGLEGLLVVMIIVIHVGPRLSLLP